MDTKLDDYLFGKDGDKPLKIFDKRPGLKDRKMLNPNEKPKLPKFKRVKKNERYEEKTYFCKNKKRSRFKNK